MTKQITFDELVEMLHDEANPDNNSKQYWYGYAKALARNDLISYNTFHRFTQFVATI